MKNFCVAVAASLFLLLPSITQAEEPECAAEARKRAHALLSFHSDNDDRVAIDDTVKQLPSLRNPADPKQRLNVLEVRGYIYKATYRLRLIYAQMPGCILMGEEVLAW